MIATECIIAPNYNVYAETGNGTDGDSKTGTKHKTGGSSASKSGFVIYICNEGGSIIASPQFVTTYSNIVPPTNSKFYLKTRVGGGTASTNAKTGIMFSMPPFTDSGSGTGSAIKGWMLSERAQTGNLGAFDFITEYWGNSVAEEFSKTDNQYLVIEGVAWHSAFVGNTGSNSTIVATIPEMARVENALNGGGSWFTKKYDLGRGPVGMELEESWLGVPVPSQKSGIIDAVSVQSQGYGVVMIKSSELGKQLVKVYTTNGSVDVTKYSGCGDSYNVKDEGDYKVKKWQTSTKRTTATSDKATYEQVISGCPAVKSGSGTSNVSLGKTENALFILYERDDIEINELNRDSMKAHELSLAHIGMSGSGDSGANDTWYRTWKLGGSYKSWSPATFNAKTYANSWLADHDDTYCGAGDGTRRYATVVGYSSVNHDPSCDTEYYSINENIGGSLNSEAGASKLHFEVCPESSHDSNRSLDGFKWWHPYKSKTEFHWKDEGEEHPFTEEKVAPAYAYMSTRHMWEPELKICPWRTEGDKGYVSGTLGFSEAPIGEVTSMKAVTNKEISVGDKSDSYSWNLSFTAYHETRTCHKLTYKTVEEHDDSSDPDRVTGSHQEIDEHIHDIDWTEHHDNPSYDLSAYTINHYADKFRVQTTKTGKNDRAGEKDLKLTRPALAWNKYKSYDLGAFYTQASKLEWFPEVGYTYWKLTGNTWQTPTEELIYMLGEYSKTIFANGLHGYKLTHWVPEGTTTLPAVAAGADGGKGYESSNGTTIMGTTFSTSDTDKPTIELRTYYFDIIDVGSRKSAIPDNAAWNEEIQQSNHDAYVQQFIDNTEEQLLLNYEAINVTHDKIASYGSSSTIYTLAASASDTITKSNTMNEYVFDYKHGSFTNGDGGKTSIQSFFSSIDAWGGFGLEKSLADIFISDTDGADMNGSGNEHSGSSLLGNTRWYDEQSIKLVVREYKTVLQYGQITADDKVDYGTIGQDVKNKVANGNSILKAHIYKRLRFVDNAILQLDGYEYDLSDLTIMVSEVKETDFLVTNEHTGSMIKR